MADEQISMFSDEAAPVTGKPSSFSISKTINGKAQRVFDHWLIPVFLEEWMFGKHTGHDAINSLNNTVRRGGQFCYKVSSGQKSINILGRYQELDIPTRLSFSWLESSARQEPDDVETNPETCQCSVSFDEADGKTRVKLQVRVPPALTDSKEAIRADWTERCNALSARFRK